MAAMLTTSLTKFNDHDIMPGIPRTNLPTEHYQSSDLTHDELVLVERSNVLFAVTGSVAAIKGPELAVQLVKVANAHVRVLLTRGGKNFWTKAKDYNLQYWDEMSSLLGTGDKQGRKIEIIGKQAVCLGLHFFSFWLNRRQIPFRSRSRRGMEGLERNW